MSLVWPSEMGDWEWNEEPMIWPGGQPLNLEGLWAPQDIEFVNHPQPGVDGLLPRDAVLGELRADIDYLLSGLVLPDGSPAENVGAGIAANYAHLIEVVGSPATWPTRKGVTTTLQRSDGTTLEGLAQGKVSKLGARQGAHGTATVSVVAPQGLQVVDP